MADEPTATEAPTAPTTEAPAAPSVPVVPSSDSASPATEAALDQIIGRTDAPPTKVEPETAPAATAEAPAAPAPGIDRDALTKAFGTLRRDNVPDAVIEHLMKNDPDKLLAWADKAGKRQGDIDKILNGKKPEPEAKEPTEEPQAEPTGQPATNEALADLVRPFAEEMGSERAQETLTKLASYVRESTLAEVRQAFERFERQFGVMAPMLERMALKEARASLRERFPQVADDATWARITSRASTLSASGGYEDIEGMVTDATKLELADLTVRDRQAEVARSHKARANGTPTAPTRSRKHTPSSPEEKREAILDEMFPV